MNAALVVVIGIVILAYAIPCAVLAGRLRRERGGSYDEGFVLGLVLGVFGILIAAYLD